MKDPLNKPYPVEEEHIRFYQENGYIKLKQVLEAELLDQYGKEIIRKVKELNTLTIPMEERTTYQKAFLQVPNLWRESELVRGFVFGKRLAGIAAALMKSDSVRLYHDQALYKEPSGGITPWHADQFYWPLETDKSVTAWIPLQAIPLDMGPLAFSKKSHNFTYGRDLPISDESERQIQEALAGQGFELSEEPFDPGDVSFHSGWTFHRAGANTTERPRGVMTVIYIDGEMRLKEPSNDNQVLDRDTWCPGVKVGEVINSPLNPVLYP